MYLPKLFAESNLTRLQDLIEDYNFGTLLCQRELGTAEVVHVPFLLDRSRGPYGALLGHVARANPVWRLFDGSATAQIIFQGPHGYISPTWYVSRQVPTWNYAVVHTHGVPQLMGDSELVQFLHNLVEKHEGKSASAWRIADLPPDLFEKLRKEIVGFAMVIDRITGKFKLGQNRSLDDRRGAINGLQGRGQLFDTELASLMARAVADLE
jgi:transcriptional regulator